MKGDGSQVDSKLEITDLNTPPDAHTVVLLLLKTKRIQQQFFGNPFKIFFFFFSEEFKTGSRGPGGNRRGSKRIYIHGAPRSL